MPSEVNTWLLRSKSKNSPPGSWQEGAAGSSTRGGTEPHKAACPQMGFSQTAEGASSTGTAARGGDGEGQGHACQQQGGMSWHPHPGISPAQVLSARRVETAQSFAFVHVCIPGGGKPGTKPQKALRMLMDDSCMGFIAQLHLPRPS